MMHPSNGVAGLARGSHFRAARVGLGFASLPLTSICDYRRLAVATVLRC